MVTAEEEVACLVRQQNPQQGQGKRPAAGQGGGVTPNPMQRKKVTLIHQRRLPQAEILHKQGAGAGGGENTHDQQA